MKRRNFLKILPPATITPFVVNGHSMRPFANNGLASLLASCEDVEGRTLVLIQLKGGNDGLNMVIPVAQYEDYVALRPNIAIPETGANAFINLDSTLKSSKQAGIHPKMVEIKEMYDEGWVNVIQGVGYEQPNQSHFKSTDLWLSGGDGTPANFNIPSGWMGRSLQALFPDVQGAPTELMPDPLGIQVGDANPSLGFHTESEHQNVINLSGQDVGGFYSLISTIGGAPPEILPDFEHGEEIEYIMSVENSVNLYAERISQVFNAGTNMGTYPNSGFANQLKTIARLIRGGSKTKIFLCQLGGFDTHDLQVQQGTTTEGNHADLMATLSQGVKAFFDDLDAMGIAKQVVACTFSEFGRCAKENGSIGTDHGTLAPMMIFGKGINPGISGTNVNLGNLTNDNQLQGIQHDYRQVFTTLLQDWLGANDFVLQETLFDSYMKMPLISSNYVVDPGCYYGGSVLVNGVKNLQSQQSLSVFPNPARFNVEVFFVAQSSFQARLSLHSMGGQVLYNGKTPVQQGDNVFHLDVANAPAGIYFVRLENLESGMAEVTKLTVVK